MNMKPLADRVLIQVEKESNEKKTAGGIVLATKTPEGVPVKGVVVAVGDGKTTPTGEKVPVSVKVGDKVLFSPNAGQKLKLDDTEYVLMYESEIYGTVEE